MWRHRKARILPVKFSSGIQKSRKDFWFPIFGNASEKFLKKIDFLLIQNRDFHAAVLCFAGFGVV